MQVRVFRNLTRKCYSIQARIAGKGWRTVAHADAVELSSAIFHVSAAGRARVLATGRKVVHAWVQGELYTWSGPVRSTSLPQPIVAALVTAYRTWQPPTLRSAAPATYNPRQHDSFIWRDTGERLDSASYARLDSEGLRAVA
jgi:hypothetical protein